MTVLSRHRVFEGFVPFAGSVPAGVDVDYLGVRWPDWLEIGGPLHLPAREVVMDCPPLEEGLFEWISLLSAVACAEDELVMLELGAGWGRWLARAAVAAHQRGLHRLRLIGVEAERTHFEWMQMVLDLNGVSRDCCELHQAAVAARDGEVLFYAGNPGTWYGQAICKVHDSTYLKNNPGVRVETVPAVSLGTLLAPLAGVDLIDMDVQGVEADILEQVPNEVDARVRLIHVGTHSPEIEARLERFFSGLGWICGFNFPLGPERETPYGRVSFCDGAQSWVNPRFPELARLLRDER